MDLVFEFATILINFVFGFFPLFEFVSEFRRNSSNWFLEYFDVKKAIKYV